MAGSVRRLRTLIVSRTRCGVLHAAHQSRQPTQPRRPYFRHGPRICGAARAASGNARRRKAGRKIAVIRSDACPPIRLSSGSGPADRAAIPEALPTLRKQGHRRHAARSPDGRRDGRPLIAGGTLALLPAAAKAAAGDCAEVAEADRAALAAGAVEGRAAAGHGRLGEAGRRRAFADRARRQRRGQIVRPPRRRAVFLVRRGRQPRRRHLARDPDAATSAPAECSTITRDIAVSARKPEPPRTPAGSFWQVRDSWNRDHRSSVFGLDRKAVRRAARRRICLEGVARGAARPLAQFPVQLSGPGEDDGAMGLRPDCADFVYFLRAYFAFKMGLPFGYSNCSRGFGGSAAEMLPVVRHRASRADAPAAAARTRGRRPPRPPPRRRRPPDLARTVRPSPPPPEPAADPPRPRRRRRSRSAPATFGEYLRDVGDVVHSGAVRVAANDDNTDFYTVPLTAGGAAPGHRLCRPLRPCADAGASGAGDRTARPASSSPSTPSPTARSRASGSGAAISCSCTIPRSAAPASSTSARSCARQNGAAAPAHQCRDRQESAIRRFLAASNRNSAPRISTTAWTT